MILALLKVMVILIVAGLGAATVFARDERRYIMRKLWWFPAGVFFAAMMVPHVYVLMALLIVTPALASRTRGEAAAIWLILMLSTPRLGIMLSAGSANLFDFSTYRCISVGFLIAVLTKPGPIAPRRGRMDLPFVIFFLLQIFVDLRSGSITEVGRAVIPDVLSLAVPYYCLSQSIATKTDIRRMVMTFCYGAGVQSAMALFQVYEHWPTYEMINQHLGIAKGLSQGSKMRAGLMRGNGPFAESTSFSWFLAYVMTGLLMSRDMFRSANHWRLAIGVICCGLLAAQSREGWLAAVMAVPLLDLYRGRIARAATAAGVLALGGLLVIGISHSSSRLGESLGTSGGGASATVDYRQLLWDRGLEEIRHHPLLGRAPDVVVDALNDIRQGEGIVDFVNGYIYYALVAGLVGLAALILMFVYTIAVTLLKRKQFVADPDYLRAGGLAFTVAVFTTITTFTSGFAMQNAIFMFLATALSSAAGGMALRRPRPDMAPAPVTAPAS